MKKEGQGGFRQQYLSYCLDPCSWIALPFYTDQYEVYKSVIPPAQHRAISKRARKTNHVERFNCTLRQRVSRLVRATLSFSKKLSNHIGAIRYFICDYNRTRSAALPG
jgi:IS1 family transposase